MSDLKPTLPFELTEKILELATTTLVEQERHDSTLIGQTNAFLLAASLVSHTWRNIAQPLLLKHGLVTPASIYLFTYKLKRAGVLNTHTAVRLGLSADGGRFRLRNPEVDLTPLLTRIPNLRNLEISGEKIRICIIGGDFAPDRIESVSFTGFKSGQIKLVLWDIADNFHPTSLTFIESTRTGRARGVSSSISAVNVLIMRATSLHIEAMGRNEATEALCYNWPLPRLPHGPVPNLQTLHLEASTPQALEDLCDHKESMQLWTMERLEKLTTHLPLLRNSSHWYPPNLKAVKLLRNFNSYSSWRTTAPEGQVMGIVRNLAKLKELEVPDCWRSDKVEAACEARGIALTWSADCTSSQIFRNLMHI